MSAATAPAPTVAPTIPTPRVILIRVILPVRDHYSPKPHWYIVGDLYHYEFTQRFQHGCTVNFGAQDDGSWLLDVTDLGLDPAVCLAYADAEERRFELETEEDRFDLHSDPDGKCLCAQIAEQEAILDAHKPVITAAVNERFDAWTRRRHLVALGVETGLPCCNPGMYGSWTPAPTEEAEAHAVTAAAAATDPYPTWAQWRGIGDVSTTASC